MVMVKRKRNEGKTTILLHHMVCNPYAVLVGQNFTANERKVRLAKSLGLAIDPERFVGMTNARGVHNRLTLIADDLDVMMRRYPEIVAGFIGRVEIATMTID